MALPTKQKWRDAEHPSLELHHVLVHRHVIAELVLVKRELWTSRWPDRELGDGDEKFDKPLGHVREYSSLAVAASHLQK